MAIRNIKHIGLMGICLSGTLVAMKTVEGDDEKALTRLTKHAPKKELYALFATMHQENSSLASRLLERIIAQTKIKHMLNRESEVEKLFANPRYAAIATPRLIRKISLALPKLRSEEYQKSNESVSYDGLWHINKTVTELKLTGQNGAEKIFSALTDIARKQIKIKGTCNGCVVEYPFFETHGYILNPLQKLCLCKLTRKKPGQQAKHLQDIVGTMPTEIQMLLSRKVV